MTLMMTGAQAALMRPLLAGTTKASIRSSLFASSAAAAAGAAPPASSLPLTKPDATDDSSSLLTSPLAVPPRLLMGPGPSNTHPRALAAMALPQLGHMHAPFLKIMDEIKAGLQYILQVRSRVHRQTRSLSLSLSLSRACHHRHKLLR